MGRLVRLVVVVAVVVVLATGCGTARKAAPHSGRYPVVVTHLTVQGNGLPGVRIGPTSAALLSRSQVAFTTTGSVSCAWWPVRLTVLGPSSILIAMRVNGRVASCTGGAVRFPIALRIDPRIVDVHRSLRIQLAYEVRLPGTRVPRRWNRLLVAPALARS